MFEALPKFLKKYYDTSLVFNMLFVKTTLEMFVDNGYNYNFTLLIVIHEWEAYYFFWAWLVRNCGRS